VRVLLVFVSVVVIPIAAAAQTREPVGGFAADAQLATSSLPTSEGWTPADLDATSLVPGRGFGAAGGAHVIFGPGRHVRLGAGVVGMTTQGKAEGTGDVVTTVSTRLTTLAPALAVNFGHRDGWSYLSAGWGRGKVSSEVEGGDVDPAGWGSAWHWGGGARWFLTRHVAASFDMRFWRLSARSAVGDRVAAPVTRHFGISAGVSLR
jgi:hypothetical protein